MKPLTRISTGIELTAYEAVSNDGKHRYIIELTETIFIDVQTTPTSKNCLFSTSKTPIIKMKTRCYDSPVVVTVGQAEVVAEQILVLRHGVGLACSAGREGRRRVCIPFRLPTGTPLGDGDQGLEQSYHYIAR